MNTKQINNTNNLLTNWTETIKTYPKISFKDAQKLILKIKSEKDLNKKLELRNYLICGTLYVVCDFLNKGILDVLNNNSYNFEDIINICFEIWIETLDNEYLLKVDSWSRVFNHNFYSKITQKLPRFNFVNYNNKIKPNDIIEITNFSKFLHLYFILRNNFTKVSFATFMKELEQIDKTTYETLVVNIEKNFESSDLEKMLLLFEYIYLSMTSGDTIDYNKVLSKTNIDNLKYLLTTNGIEYSFYDIDKVFIDMEEGITDKIAYATIKKYIFEESDLLAVEKEILYYRYWNGESLSQIAKRYNLSIEGIRKKIASSFKKLRNGKGKNLLKINR